MATSDSYRRQHEPLDARDFAAMLHVLQMLEGWYFIFNCGEKGGCSRVHKYVQGLRGPPYAFQKLVQTIDGRGEVPFKFFLKKLEKGFKAMEVAECLGVYNDMLVECRDALAVGDGEMCPHNVVLWDDSIVVIPRRSGVSNGASANTGGMMGSVWVPEIAEMDKWLQVGPANVLRELGTPS